MKCCAEGCDREARYKQAQLCQKHYFRYRRNGHLDIARKPARPFYQNDKGYRFLYAPDHPLCPKGGWYVPEHRVVLYAAIGPGDMACELCGTHLTWSICHVDHIDENTSNNNRANLRPLCMQCNVGRNRKPTHEVRPDVMILTFDGESKTVLAWSKDARVNLSASAIKRRKRAGASDYEALFAPKMTHNGNVHQDKRPRKTKTKSDRKNAVVITIDGRTMTAAEWSREPGVVVTVRCIVNRVRNGVAPMEAVFGSDRRKARELRNG